jgi:sarcosine oxidase, subunit delta
MLLFSCPNCGPRNETEFHYGGQAHVAYPENPEQLTDREWAEYLFYRQNTKGLFAERWVHSAGCRKWFNMLRDTVSYDVKAVYRMGEQPPVGLTAPPAAHSKSQPLAPAEAGNTNASEGV